MAVRRARAAEDPPGTVFIVVDRRGGGNRSEGPICRVPQNTGYGSPCQLRQELPMRTNSSSGASIPEPRVSTLDRPVALKPLLT